MVTINGRKYFHWAYTIRHATGNMDYHTWRTILRADIVSDDRPIDTLLPNELRHQRYRDIVSLAPDNYLPLRLRVQQRSVLHQATDYGELLLVEELVGKRKMLLNLADQSGWTALDIALKRYEAANAVVGNEGNISENYRKVALYLIRHGGRLHDQRLLPVYISLIREELTEQWQEIFNQSRLTADSLRNMRHSIGGALDLAGDITSAHYQELQTEQEQLAILELIHHSFAPMSLVDPATLASEQEQYQLTLKQELNTTLGVMRMVNSGLISGVGADNTLSRIISGMNIAGQIVPGLGIGLTIAAYMLDRINEASRKQQAGNIVRFFDNNNESAELIELIANYLSLHHQHIAREENSGFEAFINQGAQSLLRFFPNLVNNAQYEELIESLGRSSIPSRASYDARAIIGAIAEGKYKDLRNMDTVSKAHRLASDLLPVHLRHLISTVSIRHTVSESEEARVNIDSAVVVGDYSEEWENITLFCWACEDNNKAQISKLLANHPDLINQYNQFGLTPLQHAIVGGNEELIAELVNRGANINQSDIWGRSNLELAILYDKSAGSNNRVMTLLRHNYDLTQRDSYGNNSLHLACFYNLTDLQEYFARLTNLPEMIKQGNDVDGSTPLHLAVMGGSTEWIGWLHRHQADINATDIYGTETNTVVGLVGGYTPLHYAILSGRQDIITALVSAGADINCPGGGFGHTPLHLAVLTDQSDMVRFLLESSEGFIAIDHPTVPNRQSLEYTALLLAAWLGNSEIVKLLLAAGANPDSVNSKGWTALHYATSQKDAAMIGILLSYQADAFIETAAHYSPFALLSKMIVQQSEVRREEFLEYLKPQLSEYLAQRLSITMSLAKAEVRNLITDHSTLLRSLIPQGMAAVEETVERISTACSNKWFVHTKLEKLGRVLTMLEEEAVQAICTEDQIELPDARVEDPSIEQEEKSPEISR